jgi:hypothetical protein
LLFVPGEGQECTETDLEPTLKMLIILERRKDIVRVTLLSL